MARTGGAAGWGLPYTGGAQTTEDWRAAWRGLEAWRVGSSHTLPTAKAAWFGGGAEVRERQSVNVEKKKVVDSLPKLELTCL
jgi:hypothetical protein